MNDEIKKADEIVRNLHECACEGCPADILDAADLIDSLTAQLNGAKANDLIQKHIIESGTNPLDADKIVRLTMDNVDLKRQLTASQRREKAVVELIRKIYYTADDGFCDSCRKIVRMIEAWWHDDEKGEAE